MNFKKILKTFIIATLIITLTIPAYATNLQQAEQKKDKMENELNNAQKTIKDLEKLKSDTYAYVQELDGALKEIEVKVKSLQNQSNKVHGQIKESEAKIAEKEAEIQVQYESMKKRIQFMYENAEAGYIDMILGSENISDLLNKAEYLSKITKYDRDMLEGIKEIKAEIENTKSQLVAQRAEIEAIKVEEQGRQNDVQLLVNEKEKQVQQYENEISVTKKRQEQLKNEIAGQKAEIAKIKEQVDRENNKPDNNNGGGNSGGGSGNAMMLWPVPGYNNISSGYANRIHPIFGYRELHDGIDIPAPTGTPVKAALSGTVTISKLSSSAGNYIVIYHGNNIYTEYMHLNNRSVSVGTSVNKGDTIGTIGSTGWSTGPHLHFSVNLQRGSNFNPSERVNPHPYLGR